MPPTPLPLYGTANVSFDPFLKFLIGRGSL